ncbi:MAG: DoxX-like family protein [Proteobacteria bacterium]|nr:DoxX-like family protein [Pseudomonadota bacterium]
MSTEFYIRKLSKINFFARMALAFVFFYHGLIPKILFPSELELMLVKLHHLPIDALLFSQAAGVLEIMFASLIVIMRHTLWPVYTAIFVLFFLLLDVAMVMPELLVEAFNPVSINTASLTLCWIIVISQLPKEDND